MPAGVEADGDGDDDEVVFDFDRMFMCHYLFLIRHAFIFRSRPAVVPRAPPTESSHAVETSAQTHIVGIDVLTLDDAIDETLVFETVQVVHEDRQAAAGTNEAVEDDSLALKEAERAANGCGASLNAAQEETEAVAVA